MYMYELSPVVCRRLSVAVVRNGCIVANLVMEKNFLQK